MRPPRVLLCPGCAVLPWSRACPSEPDTLASALVIENQATTVANHRAFEAAARTVRTQARTILADPTLLPATGRAAYQSMLHDFITVADLLQPGPHYGTTAQDYTAWYTALRATNVTIA